MTDSEKRVVGRLLLAVSTYRQPKRFTVEMGTGFDEIGRRMAEIAEVRARNEAELEASIEAAMTLILIGGD